MNRETITMQRAINTGNSQRKSHVDGYYFSKQDDIQWRRAKLLCGVNASSRSMVTLIGWSIVGPVWAWWMVNDRLLRKLFKQVGPAKWAWILATTFHGWRRSRRVITDRYQDYYVPWDGTYVFTATRNDYVFFEAKSRTSLKGSMRKMMHLMSKKLT